MATLEPPDPAVSKDCRVPRASKDQRDQLVSKDHTATVHLSVSKPPPPHTLTEAHDLHKLNNCLPAQIYSKTDFNFISNFDSFSSRSGGSGDGCFEHVWSDRSDDLPLQKPPSAASRSA